MKFWFLFAAALAMALAQPGGAGAPAAVRDGGWWVRSYSGSAPAAGAAALKVSAGCNVTLTGSSGDTVQYTFKYYSKTRDGKAPRELPSGMQVKVRKSGDTVYVTAPQELRSRDELVVTVPRGMREARIETSQGNLDVTNFDGEVHAGTSGGCIHLDGLKAAADVRTGGGDIQVGHVGPLHCYSGGGNIRVDSTAGAARIETAGGEVWMGDAGGPVFASTAGGNIHIKHSAANVTARTAGGLIEVQEADGPVIAENSAGAIQIGSAKNVRCTSSAGAIRLRNVGGAMRASTAAGNIVAEVIGTLQDSVLSTSAGDITVYLAPTIPVTVIARGEPGTIVSDFPQIAIHRGAPGPMQSTAQGSLNGGGPVLRLVVTGGRIYLRQQR